MTAPRSSDLHISVLKRNGKRFRSKVLSKFKGKQKLTPGKSRRSQQPLNPSDCFAGRAESLMSAAGGPPWHATNQGRGRGRNSVGTQQMLLMDVYPVQSSSTPHGRRVLIKPIEHPPREKLPANLPMEELRRIVGIQDCLVRGREKLNDLRETKARELRNKALQARRGGPPLSLRDELAWDRLLGRPKPERIPRALMWRRRPSSLRHEVAQENDIPEMDGKFSMLEGKRKSGLLKRLPSIPEESQSSSSRSSPAREMASAASAA